MEDKSFDQAMKDLHIKLMQETEQEVKARAKWLFGHTVSSLVEDLADDPSRQMAVREVLLALKMVSSLELLREQKLFAVVHLKQIEVDELNNWLIALHVAAKRSAE